MGLLTDRFHKVGGVEALLHREVFHPFPRVEEREAWGKVDVQWREQFIASAQEHLSVMPEALPASHYFDYHRTGIRTEAVRRNACALLSHFVIAECLEDEGRFLEVIINRIWALCEQTSWVLAAHIFHADTTDP
ncbi:MAG: hypothetical protein ACOC29_00220, partial [Candidatus Sumerlaeota bacterium]